MGIAIQVKAQQKSWSIMPTSSVVTQYAVMGARKKRERGQEVGLYCAVYTFGEQSFAPRHVQLNMHKERGKSSWGRGSG